jgi:hypothetical protein
MSAGWVAASVRARAMARRRLGAVGARRLREAGSFEAARALLADTAYSGAATAADLGAAQRAVADAVLWQVRVLAGWVPASGTRVVRAVVAAFERENLCDHLGDLLGDGRARPAEPFDLGSLSTVWNRARTAPTPTAFGEELAASPWGEVPVDDVAAFRDATAGVWLRRCLVEVPSAEEFVVTAALLLVARAQVLEGRPPGTALVAALDGVLGPRWPAATTLDDLRAALDPPARKVLEAVTAPDRLWLAEVALRQRTADAGARLLREPLPGPERVVGAIAVLAADAWNVRAALADAAAGGGEVLGGVA